MSNYWKQLAQAQVGTISQLEGDLLEARRVLRGYQVLCLLLAALVVTAGVVL